MDKVKIDKWQKKLEDTFVIDGVLGQRLLPILLSENEYGKYINKRFAGYRTLIDSFFDFYVESLAVAQGALVAGQAEGQVYYAPIFLWFVRNFKGFRACESVLMNGYPLDGYALLRDLKDQVVFLSAIALNITTMKRLKGLQGSDPNDPEWGKNNIDKVRGDRISEQGSTLRRMLRNESGLPEDDRKILKLWEGLFHEEVHGSGLSFALDMIEYVARPDKVPLLVEPNDRAMAAYLNRSSEIAWMHLRVLPFLQLAPKAFGDKWCEKWHLLDESFRFMTSGLGENTDIARALFRLLDTKFAHNPDTHYVDRL